MNRAVIFDVDGTLVDSVDMHAEAWRKAFAEKGYEFRFEEIRKQIGKGGDQLLPVFLKGDNLKRDGEPVEELRGNIYKREFLPRVKAFPRVRELFERIKKDKQGIALASSAPEDELKVYLKLLNVADLVDAKTSADDVEKSKPHPDIFEVARSRVRGGDEAIAIGDTPYDAEAAGKAGIKCIGVRCGGFPEEQLRAAGCIAIFTDPADLLERYDLSPLAQAFEPAVP